MSHLLFTENGAKLYTSAQAAAQMGADPENRRRGGDRRGQSVRRCGHEFSLQAERGLAGGGGGGRARLHRRGRRRR